VDDVSLRERFNAAMPAAWRLYTQGAEDSFVVERPGLIATVVPAAAERSVFNSVIYNDPDAVAAGLDELAATYEQAGVLAWTVWIPEEDDATAQLVERVGHVLDAAPRAMAMSLDGIEEPELAGIDWSDQAELETLTRINDLAYGWREGTFGSALLGLPRERLHVYAARVDGEAAATMMTIDLGDDTEIAFVATLPPARGRGLATALMARSLWDARRRGQQTATLQATKAGYPVYRRLGFRDLGTLQMWERRRSEPGGVG
jgi:GNAT superfamily N-acetyltransferase